MTGTALTIIATALTLATGQPCAATDNGANLTAYATPGKVATLTTYTDAGERLVYADAPAPTDTGGWLAVHAVERAVQAGEPGPKVAAVCVPA